MRAFLSSPVGSRYLDLPNKNKPLKGTVTLPVMYDYMMRHQEEIVPPTMPLIYNR